jgi:hypothetical protein
VGAAGQVRPEQAMPMRLTARPTEASILERKSTTSLFDINKQKTRSKMNVFF